MQLFTLNSTFYLKKKKKKYWKPLTSCSHFYSVPLLPSMSPWFCCIVFRDWGYPIIRIYGALSLYVGTHLFPTMCPLSCHLMTRGMDVPYYITVYSPYTQNYLIMFCGLVVGNQLSDVRRINIFCSLFAARFWCSLQEEGDRNYNDDLGCCPNRSYATHETDIWLCLANKKINKLESATLKTWSHSKAMVFLACVLPSPGYM